MAKRRYIYRSSITGRYVSPEYAKATPDTSEREEVGPLKAAAVRIALAITGR
jgi:hypothetical protein